MPSIVSHPVVPLAIAAGLGKAIAHWRLAAFGTVASILPDIDVLSFRLGIPYGHPFGHRGATHSLFFAMLIALLAIVLSPRLKSRPLIAGLFVFLAVASHPLLDMLTDGGLGVALFWPVTNERFFFPTRVITVSTLNWHNFFGPAGLAALVSEMRWLWLPGVIVAFSLKLSNMVLFHASRRMQTLRSAARSDQSFTLMSKHDSRARS